MAGTVEVDRRRLPREPRRLTEHHRQRGRRHGHAHDPHLGCERVADRPHDHLHLHRRDRRDQQRLGHARRAGRLDRTVDHGRERRLHDRQLGHRLRREPDDHRLLADTCRRRDRHDHLRLDRERRPGCDRDPSTGAQTWQAQEKSTSAGTLTNLGASPSITVYAADGTGTLTTPDHGRERIADRPHDHLHVHRRDRRHQQRLGHARRAGRLERTVHHGRERRLLDLQLGHRLRREPDDHRLIAHDRRRHDVHDHLRRHGSGGPGATATSSTGAQTWQAQEKSTSAGSLTNLGSSPSITVYAADGSGTLTTPTTNVSALPDRPHDHLHLHRRDRRDQQRLRHARRPGRLERTVDHRRERRLLHLERRHPRRRRTDDHRLLADARGRLDLHDHLRLDRERRARRDGNLVHRRADLAGPGEVHRRRLARQPRRLAEHHRQRRRRHRHATTPPRRWRAPRRRAARPSLTPRPPAG